MIFKGNLLSKGFMNLPDFSMVVVTTLKQQNIWHTFGNIFLKYSRFLFFVDFLILSLLSNNQEKNLSALWGKFAAEILMQRWEAALADMKTLQGIIDSKVNTAPLVLLQQRTWLIHWSLFVFFNHPSGRSLLMELFFNDKYLNAIQTSCPHILRYLAIAVITNKKKRMALKDLLRVIQQEGYTYNDPITEFLDALFVQFDFEAAQQKLRECEKVLANDFFLAAFHEEFIENARLHIFETYCRIHQCVDISMIAEKLNMSETDAERWIVNLIRNAHFDAKIDSASNRVILGSQSIGVHQHVIDRTKGLSFRSAELAQAIQKLGIDASS
jgi:translation initiation factor 3 subunit E